MFKSNIPFYVAIGAFIVLTGCDGDSLQSSPVDPSNPAASLPKEQPVPIDPPESDRYSQLTGAVSSTTQVLMDGHEETLDEDTKYKVKYFVAEPTFINIQVDNTGNNSTEVLSYSSENGAAVAKIDELSIHPLSREWSSEWILLQPGRYYTVVDNTDGGYVSPPWNGSNDRVKFKMTMLASPMYMGDESILLYDEKTGEKVQPIRILETSIVTVFDIDGY